MDNGGKLPGTIIAPKDSPQGQAENESKADEQFSHHHTLAERISQFEGTSESLDFTISGIDCEYKVHSRIICARSRFFERAVKGKFAESTSKRIHLPEEDADTLELLISILYGFESSYSTALWPEAQPDFKGLLENTNQPNPRIIPPNPPIIEIGSYSETSPPNTGLELLRLYALADQASALRDTSSFVEVIREVYRCETGNYSELVRGISAIVIDNVDVLMENDEFYEVVVENGELGAELLQHIILRNRIVHSALEMGTSLAKLQGIWGGKTGL